MEEDLNENELEERLYSMFHYVDDTQTNVTEKQDGLAIVESAPRSTVRRYWRTSGSDLPPTNTIYQKTNTPKETPKKPAITTPIIKAKPKEEKRAPDPQLPAIFCLPPDSVKNTIEIIEHDVFAPVLEIESSDEDEVIEVALPPKPTITIESSDEETVVAPEKTPQKDKLKAKESSNDREVSASPVPSIVSSVSDDFIRGDCIALNISSRHPDQHSFDFSLHGSEFLAQSTPSKKKKRKRGKDATPNVEPSAPANPNNEECFATPKSKAKNKKQKTKSYAVTPKTIPNVDVYDSDSNQSSIDLHKNINLYAVTDKSLPSFDVYESDSSHSDNLKEANSKSNSENISNTSVKEQETITNDKRNSISVTETTIVDLTDNSLYDDSDITENIIIGNVTGFKESHDYGDENVNKNQNIEIKLGSTKVPAILYENLDFDNLKGKEKVCKNRRYSLSTLRVEMEKFYNESWGGEDFNHREIQKYMSRDKSLWAIDPKDKMPTLHKKKPTCNYCNRVGHRDDTCYQKPSVCYMCGNPGHVEPRCPRKICVNCGSPNSMYSSMCRVCWGWARLLCAECGQRGHPASHCPDLWRRYHNTVDFAGCLEENRLTKKNQQLFCSGCTRRGHLVHTCRNSLPFSGLPINSPYVHVYNPLYRGFNRKPQEVVVTNNQPKNKRPSKSPAHENHVSKKRNMSESDAKPKPNSPFRKRSQSRDQPEETDKNKDAENTTNTNNTATATPEKAPDFIPIGSSNHDKQGQIIQDNEVSDTSDIITSARIYVTNDIVDKLKTKEGEEWLKDITTTHNVSVENTDITSFLSIKGKVGDQEAFQSALRDWATVKPNRERSKSENEANETQSESEQSFASNDIPKNRNNLLRKINKALDSLKQDLGDPSALFKELKYYQNLHEQLLKKKVINPIKVSNNRYHINEMIKKLNMVLIGQAGLADGSKHLNELHSWHDKLINLRQKNIPIDLRKEIGEHYHCIFTATPRDDYDELVKSFNSGKNGNVMFRQLKKKKPFQISPKVRTFGTLPPHQQNRPATKGKVDFNNCNKQNTHNRQPNVDATKSKLVFYHKRLLKAKVNDSNLKKTRLELVRKLHTHIASLFRNDKMTSKTLKKMKKIQDRAQMFLNSV